MCPPRPANSSPAADTDDNSPTAGLADATRNSHSVQSGSGDSRPMRDAVKHHPLNSSSTEKSTPPSKARGDKGSRSATTTTTDDDDDEDNSVVVLGDPCSNPNPAGFGAEVNDRETLGLRGGDATSTAVPTLPSNDGGPSMCIASSVAEPNRVKDILATAAAEGDPTVAATHAGVVAPSPTPAGDKRGSSLRSGRRGRATGHTNDHAAGGAGGPGLKTSKADSDGSDVDSRDGVDGKSDDSDAYDPDDNAEVTSAVLDGDAVPTPATTRSAAGNVDEYVVPQPIHVVHDQKLLDALAAPVQVRVCLNPEKSCPFKHLLSDIGGCTYATIVALALCASPQDSLTLGEIYSFIEVHRRLIPNATRPNWKNSVRYNLSLRPAFSKEERHDGLRPLHALWHLNRDKVPLASRALITLVSRERNLGDYWVVNEGRRAIVRGTTTGSVDTDSSEAGDRASGGKRSFYRQQSLHVEDGLEQPASKRVPAQAINATNESWPHFALAPPGFGAAIPWQLAAAWRSSGVPPPFAAAAAAALAGTHGALQPDHPYAAALRAGGAAQAQPSLSSASTMASIAAGGDGHGAPLRSAKNAAGAGGDVTGAAGPESAIYQALSQGRLPFDPAGLAAHLPANFPFTPPMYLNALQQQQQQQQAALQASLVEKGGQPLQQPPGQALGSEHAQAQQQQAQRAQQQRAQEAMAPHAVHHQLQQHMRQLQQVQEQQAQHHRQQDQHHRVQHLAQQQQQQQHLLQQQQQQQQQQEGQMLASLGYPANMPYFQQMVGLQQAQAHARAHAQQVQAQAEVQAHLQMQAAQASHVSSVQAAIRPQTAFAPTGPMTTAFAPTGPMTAYTPMVSHPSLPFMLAAGVADGPDMRWRPQFMQQGPFSVGSAPAPGMTQLPVSSAAATTPQQTTTSSSQ